jgi:hypothetical protein
MILLWTLILIWFRIKKNFLGFFFHSSVCIQEKVSTEVTTKSQNRIHQSLRGLFPLSGWEETSPTDASSAALPATLLLQMHHQQRSLLRYHSPISEKHDQKPQERALQCPNPRRSSTSPKLITAHLWRSRLGRPRRLRRKNRPTRCDLDAPDGWTASLIIFKKLFLLFVISEKNWEIKETNSFLPSHPTCYGGLSWSDNYFFEHQTPTLGS